MSWRFRKTFKIIPGVKLNLTARGISATLGASPFSINVGPRGVYRNVSIPGTGIWDRQRLDAPSSQRSRIEPPPDPSQVPSAPSLLPTSPASSDTEIRSASTELLGSESMAHLRALLTDTYTERDVLTKEISVAAHEANVAASRFQKWDRGFLMKRLRKQSFAARKEAADTAAAKLAELQEQLRLTTLATEITVDRKQAEPYYRMRDEFAALSGCQKIWNILTTQTIDRVVERSTANTAITREPVSFSLDSCDLIQWEKQVPHLRNLTGGDMYVYPGFILYRASKQAFALIDSRDVTLTFVSTRFTEAETVPSDSQVVGQTWAKANKDGSPDRRFNGNHQIPIAHYGSLLFASSDGLDVRYVCSNPRLAEQFAKAWTAFRMSFDGDFHQPTIDDTAGGDESPKPQESIKTWILAFETSKAVFEGFKIAQNTFLTTITTNAQGYRDNPTQTPAVSDELVDTFMATLAEVIVADKRLEESASFVLRSARDRFRRIIQDIEGSRKLFESSLRDHRIDDEALLPFIDAITEFVAGRNEFFDASAAAIEARTVVTKAQIAALEKG